MSNIARVWFGKLRAERADEYLDYMNRVAVPELRGTQGNRGVLMMTRPDGDIVEISIISFWDSWESIQRFAGKDINKARYYPEDSDYLLYLEPELHHYEVAVGFPAASAVA